MKPVSKDSSSIADKPAQSATGIAGEHWLVRHAREASPGNIINPLKTSLLWMMAGALDEISENPKFYGMEAVAELNSAFKRACQIADAREKESKTNS